MSISRGVQRGFVVAQQMNLHSLCWPVNVRWQFPGEAVAPDDPLWDAAAESDTCTVVWNSDERPWLGARVNTALVCATMLHELGHLSGLTHSADPWSFMYPDDFPTPRACVRNRWESVRSIVATTSRASR